MTRCSAGDGSTGGRHTGGRMTGSLLGSRGRADAPRSVLPITNQVYLTGALGAGAPGHGQLRGSWPSSGRVSSGLLLRGLLTAGSTGHIVSRSSGAGTSSAASASVSVLAGSSQVSQVASGRITGIRWWIEAMSWLALVVRIVHVSTGPAGSAWLLVVQSPASASGAPSRVVT